MKHLPLLLFALGSACGGDAASSPDASTDATTTADSTTATDATVSTVDCSGTSTQLDKVVCQASGFLATLSATELLTANPALTDNATRTKWSNLPTSLVTRGGIAMGSLSASSQAAALAMMSSLLSSDGMEDLNGVRAADDYLAANGGNSMGPPGGGGLSYGADLYFVAVFGTPTTTGSWAVMFGGHHMAYNITFAAGVAYPTPNHLGVEPKSEFTINGGTYQPLAAEGDAMEGIFTALSATELQTAYLQGQQFGDVLIGPVEYGTGSSALAKAKYPTGSNRTGVLVSSLSVDQQALVTAAIKQWVADFDPMISDSLVAAYTSSAAYQDTYVAWGGTEASGVDVDVAGTYMRIDGPRVWIEVACQNGIIFQNATHYHTIYRDKTTDYANTL
jgi:hypothetical protein